MNKFQVKYLFLFFLLVGCSSKESNSPVEIVWNDNKAVEIILSNPSVLDLPEGKLQSILKVELGDTGEPMLGQFFSRDGKVIFQPVVPFTRGMHYHVLANDIILTELDIPLDENVKAPILSIFPTTDTLPENILKVYLRFSEPMVEGKSLRHIHLLNDKGDTLEGTFLDLQPELWNTEGTILTLWFDPGRVKRDLIPNQELGSPILQNQKYILVIDRDWKSKAGKEIGITTTRNFEVGSRDEEIPSINAWGIQVPNSNTLDALTIHFKEALDYTLVQSSIQIKSQKGAVIEGKFSVMDDERSIQFIPLEEWRKATYLLQVETKLEDLAGNNLLRPFDRDVTKAEAPEEKEYVSRKFEVK
jgi:hypothetical protein